MQFRNSNYNTKVYADDQVILASSEDEILVSVYKLNIAINLLTVASSELLWIQIYELQLHYS